jgi:hypothetical protein
MSGPTLEEGQKRKERKIKAAKKHREKGKKGTKDRKTAKEYTCVTNDSLRSIDNGSLKKGKIISNGIELIDKYVQYVLTWHFEDLAHV